MDTYREGTVTPVAAWQFGGDGAAVRVLETDAGFEVEECAYATDGWHAVGAPYTAKFHAVNAASRLARSHGIRRV